MYLNVVRFVPFCIASFCTFLYLIEPFVPFCTFLYLFIPFCTFLYLFVSFNFCTCLKNEKRWFWLNVKALAEEHQWRLKTFCALSDACVWHVCTLASFPRLHLWGAAPWRLLADPGGILQWISLLKITVWKSLQKVSLYNIASEASIKKVNFVN